MRFTLAFACVALALARDASADPVASPLGVPALMQATQDVDLAHYVYLPVLGSWIAVGRPGIASGALVFDGLCQNVVDLVFLAGVLREPMLAEAAWRVLPWFPQSGGGGVSLQATF